MMPGMIASAVNASRQFSNVRMVTAVIRRINDTDGEMTAICSRPLVVSTSPVRRDRIPPVFMSHSFGRGRWSMRSNKERRSDSMTRMLRSFCR
jgi:hypothetical protein